MYSAVLAVNINVHMLSWSLTFFVLAVLAGIFGFTGIASTMAWVAQILFVLFLVLFVISLLFRGADKVDRFVDDTI